MPDFDGIQIFNLATDQSLKEVDSYLSSIFGEEDNISEGGTSAMTLESEAVNVIDGVEIIAHEPNNNELLSIWEAALYLPENIGVRPRNSWDDRLITAIDFRMITDYGAVGAIDNRERYEHRKLMEFRFIYPGMSIPNCKYCAMPISYPAPYLKTDDLRFVRTNNGIHITEPYDRDRHGDGYYNADGIRMFYSVEIDQMDPRLFIYVRHMWRGERWDENFQKWEYREAENFYHMNCLRPAYMYPVQCKDCLVIVEQDDALQIHNSSTEYYICDVCEPNWSYEVCRSCDATFDDTYFDYEYAMCNYCAETAREQDEEEDDEYGDSSVIHSYSWKPIPNFLNYSTEERFPKLYFGAEIEVEMRRDYEYQTNSVAEDLQNHVNSDENYLYLKHDGSLSNGFEIVTHPATFEWWTQKDNPILSGISSISDKIRSYHSQNCGIHIHMSKDQFSSYHLMRFLWFIHNNQDYIEFIAQRRSNSYARFEQTERDNLLKIAKNKYSTAGRFVAVNLENSYTIEVRVFKGNIKPERILKNIEFCHALYVYTFLSSKGKPDSYLDIAEHNSKMLSDITNDLTVDQFNAWVTENAEQYPNLAQFITYWRD